MKVLGSGEKAELGGGVRRICTKHDIWTVFTIIDTLRQQLTRIKYIDPTLKKWYIGYLAAVDLRDQEEPGDTPPSSVQAGGNGKVQVYYSRTCLGETTSPGMGQHIYPSSTKQETTESVLVKEALHISLAGQHTLLNKEQGAAISDCWRPLFRGV